MDHPADQEDILVEVAVDGVLRSLASSNGRLCVAKDFSVHSHAQLRGDVEEALGSHADGVVDEARKMIQEVSRLNLTRSRSAEVEQHRRNAVVLGKNQVRSESDLP